MKIFGVTHKPVACPPSNELVTWKCDYMHGPKGEFCCNFPVVILSFQHHCLPQISILMAQDSWFQCQDASIGIQASI